MKTTPIFFLLLLAATLTSTAVPAQTTGFKSDPVIHASPEDIRGIKQTLEGLYHALAERDAQAYGALTAPGYYVLEQGVYWDLEYTLNLVGQKKPEGYSRKDSLDYKIIEVCNDTAFVVWDLFAEVIRDGALTRYQWLESGTLKKIDGQWKVHILHSTRVENK
ncbi:nuclear transport factor 2 family protein [Robertkochia flava]|uniref:nuclear transport factor 2 family protein n=1 Tax=Robertkochia flava TaxID=3447986 RepID=UPI001CCBBAC5|nr:nuclear transport factor 2 family protein [Robertkochia marina]